MGKDLKGRELGSGFYQRQDGTYTYRFNNRFGKRAQIYNKDLQELRKLANQAVYEDENAINCVNENMTLNDYFDTWINVHKFGLIRPSTKVIYVTVYNKHIRDEIGKVKIKDLKSVYLKKKLIAMHNAGYKHWTINRVRIILYDMLNWCIEDELLMKNPCKKVNCMFGDSESDVRALTIEEQQAFFECAAGTFYNNLFIVAIETGLRPGELYALTIDDIDFKERLINVDKTLTYQKFDGDNGKEYHVGQPKTKSSIRKVPITKKCEEALQRQLNQRKVTMSKNVMQDRFKNNLFLSQKGTALFTENYSHAIRSIIDTINITRDPLEQIDYFGGHCFRHTFATRCFEAGVQPKTVQQYLGHASLQMTMDLYTHVFDDFKQAEILKLEDYNDSLNRPNIYVVSSTS